MKNRNYTVYLISLSFCTLIIFFSGCSKPVLLKNAEVTGYCGCGKCCGWERGRWKYLKLNFWNKYISYGKLKGKPYSGKTAGGTKPKEPVPGLFSIDSLKHPWMIPVRTIFFPWLFMPQDGTVAADTRYHPFGTRLYIPGYGKGVVEDRGGAIKGEKRFDVFFNSHQKALKWGRKKIDVEIID
ncbi:MAG: hypothetical protein DRH24_13755 [Deltaproteobacteria bacterium]|nr:MAG: hypothetical protein DRH24_13755 [Deltaproteobacteria bacterium]